MASLEQLGGSTSAAPPAQDARPPAITIPTAIHDGNTAAADNTRQPSPSNISMGSAVTAATSSLASSTAVKWADEMGKRTAEATTQVATETTKMIGWTYQTATQTATGSRGLRPMHVRVSVRVHHVAFLHPGLDNGGRTTIGDKGSKWRRGHKQKVSSANPGLLNFGKQKGSWKNPMVTPKAPKSPFGKSTGKQGAATTTTAGAGGNANIKQLRKDLDTVDTTEAAEISEIISAEAFRLSRDGIIQHHYALNNAAKQHQQQQQQQQQTATTPQPTKTLKYYNASSRRLVGGAGGIKPNPPPNNPHSSMLSPYSAAHPEEAARYHKECAERPKGYRRLVVSSAMPTHHHDVPVSAPPPMTPTASKMGSNYGASTFARGSGGGGDPLGSKRLPVSGKKIDKSDNNGASANPTNGSTWHFEQDDSAAAAEEEEEANQKKDGVNENLFDNVEYQYIGPPQTGPEFFQLLRSLGAATFGRYLPEVACSVPNHSIGFEIRKPTKSRCYGSTQPLVVEAPHVIWGDARDKMLSRIATEGCPLIDSRKFEYVSNATINDECELSESLMVCGATLWVQDAVDDDASTSSTSTLKPNYTKGMIKAEYYGGKMADGMKEGVDLGVEGLKKGTKGIVKGTKGALHVVEKGTKKVFDVGAHGGKKLLAIPESSESASTTQAPTTVEGGAGRQRKGSKKLKNMFNPKKVFKRRSRGSTGGGDDEQSVDGSISSSVADDMSIASGSIAADSSHAVKDVFSADEDFDTTPRGQEENIAKKDVAETKVEELEDEFTVIQPVAYTLLLDDIIDIRIVSFPDKDDVIANFPVSVASVMVQRSVDDRIKDPLKPSELTATLIQEPSASLLRWGVELKVTLRAVEVKPQLPRVIPRPKDVIDEEMHKMKERLIMLGKKPVDIKKDLHDKEMEHDKEENDLNQAIVAFGYGKGENEGKGQESIRLRQMFYCEREHETISRKLKRRTVLTSVEKNMINDAQIDPSSVKKKVYTEEERRKVLEMLDFNFPGIDSNEEDDSEEGETVTSANTGGTAAIVHDSLAKVSIRLAKSLDKCLITDQPTVPVVRQRLNQTFSEGTRQNVTNKVAKQWCSEVGGKLSSYVNSLSTSETTPKSSIIKLQNIIAESALESTLGSALDPGSDFAEFRAFEPTKEEAKVDEDEIALQSSKLVDWVTAVAAQMEALAVELDDDQESLAYSTTMSNTKQEPVGRVDSFDNNNIVPYPYLAGDPPGRSGGEGTRPSSSRASICSRSSISTMKDAFPMSSSKSNSKSMDSLLKSMKSSHRRTQQINVQTSSLSTTLVYLVALIAALALGTYAVSVLFQEAWSLMRAHR